MPKIKSIVTAATIRSWRLPFDQYRQVLREGAMPGARFSKAH
jgi:hypothetical protein